MHQLVVASNNRGKIEEILQMIPRFELLSLKDIGYLAEIAEPFFTFEENALIKAKTIHEFCGINCFADDSGLCIEALNGAPGVDSAHYSGSRNDEDNLQRVLAELDGFTDRRAYYKAVICLIWEGDVHYFEGICSGAIAQGKVGTGGFGYDPIFIPDGYSKTFGELDLVTKNQISHRGKAVKKMVDFLNLSCN